MGGMSGGSDGAYGAFGESEGPAGTCHARARSLVRLRARAGVLVLVPVRVLVCACMCACLGACVRAYARGVLYRPKIKQSATRTKPKWRYRQS